MQLNAFSLKSFVIFILQLLKETVKCTMKEGPWSKRSILSICESMNDNIKYDDTVHDSSDKA